jgi:hypothetical protein
MSNKIIDLTGDQIESALQVVHNADGSPLAGSPNHVNSGNIHTYVTAAIDGSLNNGPKITASTFNGTTLVDSLDTLATNADDDKLATTLAIKNYVQAQPMVTVANIYWQGGVSNAVVVTNDANIVTVNTNVEEISGGDDKVTVNVVANGAAKYLILGTTVTNNSGALGLTTNQYSSFFDASNSDVLLNLTGTARPVELNLTIIRFA